MKYIDAEKLKVLLSDLKENHKYYNGDFHDGVVFAVDETEELIDSLSVQKDNGSEEYIRKDIVDETIKTAEDHAYFAGQEKFREKLMAWAKEHKCVIETHGDERDTYLRGEYSVLNSLIDQLNSM